MSPNLIVVWTRGAINRPTGQSLGVGWPTEAMRTVMVAACLTSGGALGRALEDDYPSLSPMSTIAWRYGS